MGRQLFLSRVHILGSQYVHTLQEASNQLIQPEGPASSIPLVIP